MKGEKPAVLHRNGSRWTADYVAARDEATRKRLEKWRHADIKAALREETQSKCAYCEVMFEDASYLNVDHIVPKSVRRDLAHEWINMTGSCTVCNGNKGAYYDDGNFILNPYVDAINDALIFYGDFVDWAFGDTRAEITVKQLQLNRIELIKSRIDRLHAVREMMERWSAANEPLRSVLQATIEMDALHGEFSASVVAYLRMRNFPLASRA